nr:YebC/PmpR family DNA-binding transcriptional regulator [Anaerolinea sp.]
AIQRGTGELPGVSYEEFTLEGYGPGGTAVLLEITSDNRNRTVAEIRSLTGGKGVDVSIELIGLPLTMRQAFQSLAVFGRSVVVGISDRPLEIDTYHELLGPETELIGSNDHLLQELPLVVEMARRGILDLSNVVSRTVPLEAGAINQALDQLEAFGNEVRTVIVP